MDKKTIVIAGAGPAGLTCAMYLARAGHDVKVYSNEENTTSCLDEAAIIENYPGFPGGIPGYQLRSLMQEQAEAAGAAVLPQGISMISDGRDVCFDTDGTEVNFDHFVMAVGVTHRKWTCPGCDPAAVHRCAVCDGGLYTKDDTLAVIGGGDTAMGDALYLSGIVGKVYVLIRRDVLRVTTMTVYDRLQAQDNVEIMKSTYVTGMAKDQSEPGGAQSWTLELNGGAKPSLSVNGVFACVGSDYNYIEGYHLRQNAPDYNHNLWRIGDCKTGARRQVISAAADGAEAALDIIDSINGN